MSETPSLDALLGLKEPSTTRPAAGPATTPPPLGSGTTTPALDLALATLPRPEAPQTGVAPTFAAGLAREEAIEELRSRLAREGVERLRLPQVRPRPTYLTPSRMSQATSEGEARQAVEAMQRGENLFRPPGKAAFYTGMMPPGWQEAIPREKGWPIGAQAAASRDLVEGTLLGVHSLVTGPLQQKVFYDEFTKYALKHGMKPEDVNAILDEASQDLMKEGVQLPAHLAVGVGASALKSVGLREGAKGEAPITWSLQNIARAYHEDPLATTLWWVTFSALGLRAAGAVKETALLKKMKAINRQARAKMGHWLRGKPAPGMQPMSAADAARVRAGVQAVSGGRVTVRPPPAVPVGKAPAPAGRVPGAVTGQDPFGGLGGGRVTAEGAPLHPEGGPAAAGERLGGALRNLTARRPPVVWPAPPQLVPGSPEYLTALQRAAAKAALPKAPPPAVAPPVVPPAATPLPPLGEASAVAIAKATPKAVNRHLVAAELTGRVSSRLATPEGRRALLRAVSLPEAEERWPSAGAGPKEQIRQAALFLARQKRLMPEELDAIARKAHGKAFDDLTTAQLRSLGDHLGETDVGQLHVEVAEAPPIEPAEAPPVEAKAGALRPRASFAEPTAPAEVQPPLVEGVTPVPLKEVSEPGSVERILTEGRAETARREAARRKVAQRKLFTTGEGVKGQQAIEDLLAAGKEPAAEKEPEAEGPLQVEVEALGDGDLEVRVTGVAGDVGVLYRDRTRISGAAMKAASDLARRLNAHPKVIQLALEEDLDEDDLLEALHEAEAGEPAVGRAVEVPPAPEQRVLQAWRAAKERQPDTILFFRRGDFYELFYEDARTASEVLGLALTSRGKGDQKVPMAGVPYDAADGYLRDLIKAGHKVAIVEEQGEALAQAPEEAPGLPAEAPGVSRAQISLKVAQRAHEGTSMVPETRAKGERDQYVSHMQAVWDSLRKLAKTDEERERALEEFGEYSGEWASRYMAVLSSRSGLLSAMITGPSGFPTRQQKKRGTSYENKLTAFMEWDKKAQRRMRKNVKPSAARTISSDLDEAPRILQEKIDTAKKLQETMKAANSVIRRTKLSDAEKIASIQAEAGLSEKVAKGLLEPDASGRLGFPAYELTNNLAKIRRMEKRIGSIQATRAAAPLSAEFEGGTIEENPANNRLQIFFDEKPDAEMRDALKKEAFRWAPSEKAWQRQRTAAAVAAAERIFDVELTAEAELEPEDAGIVETPVPEAPEAPEATAAKEPRAEWEEWAGVGGGVEAEEPAYLDAIEETDTYDMIERNEGPEARALVQALNAAGVKTLDTHSVGEAVVVHLAEDHTTLPELVTRALVAGKVKFSHHQFGVLNIQTADYLSVEEEHVAAVVAALPTHPEIEQAREGLLGGAPAEPTALPRGAKEVTADLLEELTDTEFDELWQDTFKGPPGVEAGGEEVRPGEARPAVGEVRELGRLVYLREQLRQAVETYGFRWEEAKKGLEAEALETARDELEKWHRLYEAIAGYQTREKPRKWPKGVKRPARKPKHQGLYLQPEWWNAWKQAGLHRRFPGLVTNHAQDWQGHPNPAIDEVLDELLMQAGVWTAGDAEPEVWAGQREHPEQKFIDLMSRYKSKAQVLADAYQDLLSMYEELGEEPRDFLAVNNFLELKRQLRTASREWSAAPTEEAAGKIADEVDELRDELSKLKVLPEVQEERAQRLLDAVEKRILDYAQGQMEASYIREAMRNTEREISRLWAGREDVPNWLRGAEIWWKQQWKEVQGQLAKATQTELPLDVEDIPDEAELPVESQKHLLAYRVLASKALVKRVKWMEEDMGLPADEVRALRQHYFGQVAIETARLESIHRYLNALAEVDLLRDAAFPHAAAVGRVVARGRRELVPGVGAPREPRVPVRAPSPPDESDPAEQHVALGPWNRYFAPAHWTFSKWEDRLGAETEYRKVAAGRHQQLRTFEEHKGRVLEILAWTLKMGAPKANKVYGAIIQSLREGLVPLAGSVSTHDRQSMKGLGLTDQGIETAVAVRKLLNEMGLRGQVDPKRMLEAYWPMWQLLRTALMPKRGKAPIPPYLKPRRAEDPLTELLGQSPLPEMLMTYAWFSSSAEHLYPVMDDFFEQVREWGKTQFYFARYARRWGDKVLGRPTEGVQEAHAGITRMLQSFAGMLPKSVVRRFPWLADRRWLQNLGGLLIEGQYIPLWLNAAPFLRNMTQSFVFTGAREGWSYWTRAVALTTEPEVAFKRFPDVAAIRDELPASRAEAVKYFLEKYPHWGSVPLLEEQTGKYRWAWAGYEMRQAAREVDLARVLSLAMKAGRKAGMWPYVHLADLMTNRFLTFWTARLKFLSLRDRADYSGAYPGTKKLIREAMDEGRWSDAADLYAVDVTLKDQVEYSSLNRGGIDQGMGKLFTAYTTFPRNQWPNVVDWWKSAYRGEGVPSPLPKGVPPPPGRPPPEPESPLLRMFRLAAPKTLRWFVAQHAISLLLGLGGFSAYSFFFPHGRKARWARYIPLMGIPSGLGPLPALLGYAGLAAYSAVFDPKSFRWNATRAKREAQAYVPGRYPYRRLRELYDGLTTGEVQHGDRLPAERVTKAEAVRRAVMTTGQKDRYWRHTDTTQKIAELLALGRTQEGRDEWEDLKAIIVPEDHGQLRKSIQRKQRELERGKRRFKFYRKESR